MKKPGAVESSCDGHNPLLPKLGQKYGKIVNSMIVPHLRKPHFYLQCMIVSRRTKSIYQHTQLFVNRTPRFCLLCKIRPGVYVPR